MYLHVDVHYEKLGDAFDDIRKHDDQIDWSGFGAHFTKGGAVSAGLNPLKAVTRERLLDYAENCRKSRSRYGGLPSGFATVYLIFRENDFTREFAVELSMRYGKSILRLPSPQL